MATAGTTKQTHDVGLENADFTQCFYMLRHYDQVNWDLTKFAFGQVMVVIGACWSIVSVGATSNDLNIIATMTRTNTGVVVGIMMALSTLFLYLSLISVMKNRTYFVQVSRYINEYRNIFLTEKLFGFENKSNMWHDANYPKNFDWKSTQMICMYLIGACMILSSFISVFCLTISCVCAFVWGLLAAVVSLLLIIITAVLIFK